MLLVLLLLLLVLLLLLLVLLLLLLVLLLLLLVLLLLLLLVLLLILLLLDFLELFQQASGKLRIGACIVTLRVCACGVLEMGQGIRNPIDGVLDGVVRCCVVFPHGCHRGSALVFRLIESVQGLRISGGPFVVHRMCGKIGIGQRCRGFKCLSALVVLPASIRRNTQVVCDLR